jgi:hypothetical protein
MIKSLTTNQEISTPIITNHSPRKKSTSSHSLNCTSIPNKVPTIKLHISDSNLLTYLCLQILPYAITTHIVTTIKTVIYAITAIIRFYQPFDKLLIAHLPNLIRLVHAQSSINVNTMFILGYASHIRNVLTVWTKYLFVLVALL